MMYKECEYCGATLDSGERCDCIGSQKSHDEYIVVIAPNGECTVEKYVANTRLQLRQLQELVGGYIAITSACKDGYIIIVDDEGALKDVPLNLMASKAVLFPRQTIIFGPAVVAKVGTDAEGEQSICGMTLAEAKRWLSDLALLEPSL